MIVVTLVTNIYIWYADTERKEFMSKELIETLVEGVVAIVSYFWALKYYHLCNTIDTTPILSSEKSLELEAVSINEENS